MTVLAFGERHPDYSVRVLNEREARAGAGILLVIALIAFSNAFLAGDFTLTRIAIVGFGLDFLIRVVINPRYAPSLVVGRFMVRKQVPEYTGAPQKRFAWALGLALAAFMGVWLIWLNLSGPVALLACLVCILLLFFETAFGICLGCRLYEMFRPGLAQLCPGGTCEVREPDPIQRVAPAQVGALVAALLLIGATIPALAGLPSPGMHRGTSAAPVAGEECEVPAFAVALGHQEQWKLHNGCI